MDRIVDDAAWAIRPWEPANSWSLWGDIEPPEVFFNPTDMDEIAAGYAKAPA